MLAMAVLFRLYGGRVIQGPLRGTPVIFKVIPLDYSHHLVDIILVICYASGEICRMRHPPNEFMQHLFIVKSTV